MMTTLEELRAMLDERENDLHLAGELGKALLEKNEELTREHDQTCQEYHSKVEKVKSENLWLKNQLSKHSSEWDDAMKTHNEDVNNLREQLKAKAQQFALQAQGVQERNQLADQNKRLSLELDKVLESEKLLRSSNQDMKRRLDELKSTNSHILSDYESLAEKESLIRRKQQDADIRVSMLSDMNERYTKKIDELTYKNTSLEREKLDALEQVRHNDKQIEMLKEKNTELFERIHELVHNPSLNSPSFLEELEYSQKSLTSGYSSNLSLLDELDSDEAITMLPVDNFSQLKLEVLDTYQELQAIVDELEASECASSTPGTQTKAKVTNSKDISNGELISTAKHVRYLVTRRHQMGSLLAQIADMKNSLSEQSKKMGMLEADLDEARRSKVNKHSEELEQQLKQEQEEYEATLNSLKDELESAKAENRKLERELLETIQKKIKLSQQVEQWQLDMEEMVENQVRTMFLLEQKSNSKPLTVISSPGTPSTPSTPTSNTASPSGPPEIKQSQGFVRNDKRRFSLFRRKNP